MPTLGFVMLLAGGAGPPQSSQLAFSKPGARPALALEPVDRHRQASPCGRIDAQTAARMALAQVARDQFMARVLQSKAGRRVVLLAGNGQVRGEAIAVLESGDGHRDHGRWMYAAPQARSDPCAAMTRKP